jgi:hypothetical protein
LEDVEHALGREVAGYIAVCDVTPADAGEEADRASSVT